MKMPKTKTGKWAVGFGIALVVLMALSLLIASIAVDMNGNSMIADNPLIMVLNAALNISGLLSLILGIFTIIKYKEWLVLKYLGILYGITILLFLLGEFIFPH